MGSPSSTPSSIPRSAASGASIRSRSPRPASRAARACCSCAAGKTIERRALTRLAERIVARGARRRRAGHRQRSRGHRAARAAPTACTSVRPICPSRPCARSSGHDRIVGISTHDREQIDAALASDASYVAVGPVFRTATKDTGYTPRGLDLVRYAARPRQARRRHRRHHPRAGGGGRRGRRVGSRRHLRHSCRPRSRGARSGLSRAPAGVTVQGILTRFLPPVPGADRRFAASRSGG